MLDIIRATGLVTIQDAGRPGSMHLAIPPGGPLSPSLYRATNAAVGNAPTAAAIEIVGSLSIKTSLPVSIDGARAFASDEIITITSTPDHRVRYLAIRGGLDVPLVHGGRGTLLVASLGGHEGRILRRGDSIPTSTSTPPAALPPVGQPSAAVATPTPAPATIIPGPDPFPPSSLSLLLSSSFRLSPHSDRIGARLEGPAIPFLASATRRSTPMVAGAIEITPDGTPIVLGPDHPTTGGYPVIAVVVAADVEKVLAAPIGATVRFACRTPVPSMDHGDPTR